jgi:hypothetical protein
VTREPVLDEPRMEDLEIVQRRLAVILRPFADHLAFSRRFQLTLPAGCGLVESCPRVAWLFRATRQIEVQPSERKILQDFANGSVAP